MKQLLLTLFALTALFSSAQAQEKAENTTAGKLRHIVMVKFKEETTPEQIKDLEVKFGQLEKKIETIIDYEWGHAATAEPGLDQGFTHCFVVTFEDKAGLKVYLPHEAHQAFVAVFKPQIDKLLVLDYVAK